MSTTIDSADLYFKSGSSDKEYHVQLVEDAGSYLVNFQYGRRGSTLNPGCKTKVPVSLEAARKVFNKIVAEKTSEGYTIGAAASTLYTASAAPSTPPPMADRVIPQLLNPIDELEMERLLLDDAWGAQEKKDGTHKMARKTANTVVAINKKGIEVGYPSAYADDLPQVGLYDGEAIGDILYTFDLLEYGAKNLRSMGYGKRHEFLVGVLGEERGSVKVVPLARGYAAKKALLDKLRAEKREGIVFKRLDAPYTAGRPTTGGDMLKHKFYATASCLVVAGRDGKRSVGLNLLTVSGTRVSVGNVTIPPNKDIPAVGSVVEIRYLYAYKGGSLYQPTYLEPRDDIDMAECLMTQLKYKAEED